MMEIIIFFPSCRDGKTSPKIIVVSKQETRLLLRRPAVNNLFFSVCIMKWGLKRKLLEKGGSIIVFNNFFVSECKENVHPVLLERENGLTLDINLPKEFISFIRHFVS